MRILVLGGAGYIGSHTVYELIDAGYEVIVIRLQGSSIGRLAKAIIEGKNIHDIEEIKIHADWVDEWLDFYDITTENIESIIQKELRIVLCRF